MTPGKEHNWDSDELELSISDDPVLMIYSRDEPFTIFGTKFSESSEDDWTDDEISPERETILNHLTLHQRFLNLKEFVILNKDIDEEKKKLLDNYMSLWMGKININLNLNTNCENNVINAQFKDKINKIDDYLLGKNGRRKILETNIMNKDNIAKSSDSKKQSTLENSCAVKISKNDQSKISDHLDQSVRTKIDESISTAYGDKSNIGRIANGEAIVEEGLSKTPDKRKISTVKNIASSGKEQASFGKTREKNSGVVKRNHNMKTRRKYKTKQTVKNKQAACSSSSDESVVGEFVSPIIKEIHPKNNESERGKNVISIERKMENDNKKNFSIKTAVNNMLPSSSKEEQVFGATENKVPSDVKKDSTKTTRKYKKRRSVKNKKTTRSSSSDDTFEFVKPHPKNNSKKKKSEVEKGKNANSIEGMKENDYKNNFLFRKSIKMMSTPVKSTEECEKSLDHLSNSSNAGNQKNANKKRKLFSTTLFMQSAELQDNQKEDDSLCLTFSKCF